MSFIGIHKVGNIKSKRTFATEYDSSEAEKRRQLQQHYIEEFKNPKQYIKAKLKMLRNEMFIQPTEEEIRHLLTLKSDVAIDNAIHSIIDRHWDNY